MPSRRGRLARCSNNSCCIAGRKSEGLDAKPKEVKDEALQKCILIGFVVIAWPRRLDSGTLRAANWYIIAARCFGARERRPAKKELFVVSEIREVETRDREVNTILSLATAIEPAWLTELFPEDIESGFARAI